MGKTFSSRATMNSIIAGPLSFNPFRKTGNISDGFTALKYAVSEGYKVIVKILLDNGAESKDNG